MDQGKPIEQVHAEYTDRWMALPEVVGTAQGLCDSRPCLKVYVTQITPELRARVPEQVEGYPVVLEVTGDFEAPPQDDADAHD